MKFVIALMALAMPLLGYAQQDTLPDSYEWPYSMPILGKKAVERGYKIQLPYGLNVNYVYNRMDLEISEFDMSIGDDPNSRINQFIDEYVTLETLNFTNTIARTNGMNIRADVWILPFVNVYGLYSNNTGSTEVSLQPAWYDEEGNLVLALPEVESIVIFQPILLVWVQHWWERSPATISSTLTEISAGRFRRYWMILRGLLCCQQG